MTAFFFAMSAAMYFIGVVLPEELNKEVLKHKNFMRDRYQCVVALRSPAHITLIPPFWLEQEEQRNLEEALDHFLFDPSSFPVNAKNFSCFKPRVLFIDVEPTEPLKLLRQNLADYLQPNFPIKRDDREFHPHITIANRDLRKKDFAEAWTHFQKISCEFSFTVDKISLLKHSGESWQVARNFSLSKNG